MQMSSPAPETDPHPATVQAGGQLARKYLYRIESRSAGGKAEHQPAMRFCGKGQQHNILG